LVRVEVVVGPRITIRSRATPWSPLVTRPEISSRFFGILAVALTT
jgi:hypothetical protein